MFKDLIFWSISSDIHLVPISKINYLKTVSRLYEACNGILDWLTNFTSGVSDFSSLRSYLNEE